MKVASCSDARLIAAEHTIAHMHDLVVSRDIDIARLWAEMKNAHALEVARLERACNDSATIIKELTNQLHQSKDAHASAEERNERLARDVATRDSDIARLKDDLEKAHADVENNSHNGR
jgi:hypothetical protein